MTDRRCPTGHLRTLRSGERRVRNPERGQSQPLQSQRVSRPRAQASRALDARNRPPIPNRASVGDRFRGVSWSAIWAGYGESQIEAPSPAGTPLVAIFPSRDGSGVRPADPGHPDPGCEGLHTGRLGQRERRHRRRVTRRGAARRDHGQLHSPTRSCLEPLEREGMQHALRRPCSGRVASPSRRLEAPQGHQRSTLLASRRHFGGSGRKRLWQATQVVTMPP